jgi:DNA ligase-1
MFPLDEFWNGQSKETYSERLLNYILPLRNKVTSNHFENISVVPMFYNGYDHAEIWKWLDYAENNDMEGVIVNLDTPYECKRSKNLIKVKKFYTYDLEVVDIEEGDGRNKGTLGALVVKYKNNTVNVGSGFTDEERKNFWENREDIIGRVIEVKYKEITTDKKTGLESLQFPVFCGLREIGKEPSYN